MDHESRVARGLSIVASTLAALGVVAAGVQLAEGDLGGDPRASSPLLSRPAAQVVIPFGAAEPPLAEQFINVASIAPRSSTIPVPAPGPQSVPAPGPSNDAPAAPPAPTPSEPTITPPELIEPIPTPEPVGVVDPVVALIGGLIAEDAEAGAEAPTSAITDLLDL